MSKNIQSSILITSDLLEESYQSLIDQACKTYAFFSVVYRSDLKANVSVSKILEAMKPNQYKVISSKKLPMNTIHSAYPAEIHYFTTTPRTIRPILKQVGSLFQWLMPNYPEDLCFYRADQSLAMVSNTHENIAFFFDRNFIEPFLKTVEWSEQNYTEQSFTNLLLT